MPQWFSGYQPIIAVPIGDRGLQYGDGLFETVAVRNGRIRLWALHEDRLLTSCRRIGIQTEHLHDLYNQLDAALQASGNRNANCLTKVIVTRGQGPRGYRPPDDCPPSVYVGIFDHIPCPDMLYTRGIDIRICNTRLSSQPHTAGMKLLSRIEQILARSEWNDSNISEGIMLDQSDDIVCGTMSNVFMATEHGLMTPELVSAGVAGVMRRHIISIAEQNGIPVEVKQIPATEIAGASEFFVCNSQIGIWPVSRCGHRSFGARPITDKLRRLLRFSGVIEGPA